MYRRLWQLQVSFYWLLIQLLIHITGKCLCPSVVKSRFVCTKVKCNSFVFIHFIFCICISYLYFFHNCMSIFLLCNDYKSHLSIIQIIKKYWLRWVRIKITIKTQLTPNNTTQCFILSLKSRYRPGTTLLSS